MMSTPSSYPKKAWEKHAQSYFWTKEFDGDKDTDWQKDFRFANWLIELLGAWNIRFRYRINSDASSGNSKDIYTDAGGTNWGTGVWGTSNWGGAKTRDNVRQKRKKETI